jgi:type IV pilus assembly protein PilP
MPARVLALGLSFSLLALAVGCTSSAGDELQLWMQEERNAIRPKITPIPEPSRFEPQVYASERMIDPFSAEKMASASGSLAAIVANSRLLDPELNRRKQPLEAFPLDTMRMVGSLNRNGQLVALVKVGSLLYQVRSGSYLGQNYGRVNTITETNIILREIVQDPSGEWTERPAALQLQEDASK